MLGLAIHYGKEPMLAERYKQPEQLIERLEKYLGRSAPGIRAWLKDLPPNETLRPDTLLVPDKDGRKLRVTITGYREETAEERRARKRAERAARRRGALNG
jgi:hypothetical protein